MPAAKSSKAPKACETCKKPLKTKCKCAKANGGKGLKDPKAAVQAK